MISKTTLLSILSPPPSNQRLLPEQVDLSMEPMEPMDLLESTELMDLEEPNQSQLAV
jgi:hypothetical protein